MVEAVATVKGTYSFSRIKIAGEMYFYGNKVLQEEFKTGLKFGFACFKVFEIKKYLLNYQILRIF